MSDVPPYDLFQISFGRMVGDEFDLSLTHGEGGDDGFGAFIPPKELALSGIAGVTRNVMPIGVKKASSKVDQDGELLFDALIVNSEPEIETDATIRRNYEDVVDSLEEGKIRAVRISLQFNPKRPGVERVINLPWERLFDTIRFRKTLNLLPEKCSVVRCLNIREKVKPFPITDKLNVLLVSADPDVVPARGKLKLDVEIDRIEKAIQKKMIRDANDADATARNDDAPDIDVYLVERKPGEESTEMAIRRMLESDIKFHVFHYLGHGEFDETGGMDGQGEGVLLFEDKDNKPDPMSATNLSQMLLEEYDSIRFVILNACDTAKENHAFSGVAQTLIKLGTPAVIAMREPIDDDGAIILSKTLYSHLAGPTPIPIDYALTDARKKMEEGKSQGWSVPVLYMQSQDGLLFKPAPRKGTKQDPSDNAAGQQAGKYNIKGIEAFLKNQNFDVVQTATDDRAEKNEALDVSNDEDIQKIVQSRDKEIQDCDFVLICWITGSRSWLTRLKDRIHDIRKENPPEIFYLISGQSNNDEKKFLLEMFGDSAIDALPEIPLGEDAVAQMMGSFITRIKSKTTPDSPPSIFLDYLSGDVE